MVTYHELYPNGVFNNLLCANKKEFSNIFVFQTDQHFHQKNLIISGHYLNSSLFLPVLIAVQQLIPAKTIK